MKFLSIAPATGQRRRRPKPSSSMPAEPPQSCRRICAHGITVNNLAPGVICTDRNTAAMADPVYARQVIDSIPVGYYGMPEDCVGVVRLLCAQAGRYITGQSLYVDGGKSIQ